MSAISDLLVSVRIGDARRFGRLDVFPLFAPTRSSASFLLLDEALAAKSVEVTETSDSGSVPILMLRSEASEPVLLLDGEELVGAKQNRILNTSVFAPPGRAIQIPVSCVEQGRWRYASRTFKGADHTLFAKGRAKKAARMATSRKERAVGDGHIAYSVAHQFDADQGAVWADVSDKLSAMRVHSASSAIKDGYDSYEASLRAFEEALAPLPGQTGAVFALDGKVVGAELLPTAAAFGKICRKLIRSYAFDALEQVDGVTPQAPSPDEVRVFLDRVASSDANAAAGVGLGEDIRIEGERCVGHALVHEGVVLHLAAFDQALAA